MTIMTADAGRGETARDRRELRRGSLELIVPPARGRRSLRIRIVSKLVATNGAPEVTARSTGAQLERAVS